MDGDPLRLTLEGSATLAVVFQGFGTHLLRTILPAGFEQQVREAEARVLRAWLRGLGAK